MNAYKVLYEDFYGFDNGTIAEGTVVAECAEEALQLCVEDYPELNEADFNFNMIDKYVGIDLKEKSVDINIFSF